MPDEPIRYLKEGGQGEITEKRSRFLATLQPVTSEEEALLFIEQIKKRYWDARHNCYAYVIGDRAELCRCSDDGEPPHTAGRPMLDALLASGIRNAVVVVTRYFGGILLGTGGLTRAYRDAVTEGIRHCKTLDKLTGIPVDIVTDYNGIGKLLFLSRAFLRLRGRREGFPARTARSAERFSFRPVRCHLRKSGNRNQRPRLLFARRLRGNSSVMSGYVSKLLHFPQKLNKM